MATPRAKKQLPVLVVDTREQAPFVFDATRVSTVRRALKAGDYSVEGLESQVAVERKSLDDFVGTVIRAQGRFEVELEHLGGYAFACVVVEASIEDVLSHRYRMAVHPNSVLGAAVAITVDHRIPVFFCGSRPHACLFTEKLLCRAHKKLLPSPSAGASTSSASPAPPSPSASSASKAAAG
jgi:ERCC4-type nuclease